MFFHKFFRGIAHVKYKRNRRRISKGKLFLYQTFQYSRLKITCALANYQPIDPTGFVHPTNQTLCLSNVHWIHIVCSVFCVGVCAEVLRRTLATINIPLRLCLALAHSLAHKQTFFSQFASFVRSKFIANSNPKQYSMQIFNTHPDHNLDFSDRYSGI